MIKVKLDSNKSEDENLECLKTDITKYFEPLYMPPYHSTILHKLAAMREPYIPTKIIDFLIKEGANVNAKDDKGRTPLHIATKMKIISTMKLFLKNGADVKASGCLPGNFNYIGIPLHVAAESGDPETLKLLLQHSSGGASLEVTDSHGFTPFHRAARAANLECLKLLFDYKADIKVLSYEGLTSLYLNVANIKQGTAESVNFLIKNGAKIFTTRNLAKKNPFHEAYNDQRNIEDTFKILELLLKIAAPEEVNSFDASGNNILTLTLRNFNERHENPSLDKYTHEYIKIIKMIIHHEANVNLLTYNLFGRTMSIIEAAYHILDTKSFRECFLENPDISSETLVNSFLQVFYSEFKLHIKSKQSAESLFDALKLEAREKDFKPTTTITVTPSLSQIIEEENDTPSFNNRIVQLFKNYKKASEEPFKDANSSIWLNNYIKAAFVLRENGLNDPTIKKILKTEIINYCSDKVYSDYSINSLYVKFVSNENKIEINKDCIFHIISFLEPHEFTKALWMYRALVYSFSEAQDLDNFIHIIGNESDFEL